MKDEKYRRRQSAYALFILHPSSLILPFRGLTTGPHIGMIPESDESLAAARMRPPRGNFWTVGRVLNPVKML
jgi:hypothetical protein